MIVLTFYFFILNFQIFIYINKINKKNIISNICPIFEINMYNIKEKDINFETKFELTFNMSDSLSALAGWFDVQFSKVPNTIKFTTKSIYNYMKDEVGEDTDYIALNYFENRISYSEMFNNINGG